MQPTETAVDPQANATDSGIAGQPAAEGFRRAELRFIVGFWVFVGVLTFTNTLLNTAMNGRQPALPWIAPLQTALLNSMMWATLTPLALRLTSRYSLDRPGWQVPLLLFLAAGIPISMAVALMMNYVRYWQASYYLRDIHQDARTLELALLRVSQQFWFMKEYVIYLAVLSGAYAHDYFVRYNIRHRQASELEAQAAYLRAELADARLESLRSQLNPHFLFNTLNTVSSLLERDPRGARRMLAHLSDLLRETLDNREREVRLADELHTVQLYVGIMRERFAGQIEYVEEVSPQSLHALVPTLLLQPLVENAIKHGVERRGGNDRIVIRAQQLDDQLCIEVLNRATGCQSPAPSVSRRDTGLGIANTRKRLEHSYAGRQSLSLDLRADGNAVVRIALPFHVAAMRRVGT